MTSLAKHASRNGSAPGGSSRPVRQHCKLAQRIPNHKKTGNYTVDKDNEDRREDVRTLLDELLADDTHASHLLAELRRRQRAATEAEVNGAETFKKCTTLSSLDEDWLVLWLTQVSDLNEDDVIRSKKHDNEAVLQLAQYALQYPLNLRLNEHIAIKAVARKVFQQRQSEAGARLVNFKANKGIDNEGKLNWLNGCYALQWSKNGQKVEGIKHISTGDVAKVPEHAVITKQHCMHSNWSDSLAFVELSPMPPIRLVDFFKAAGDGPMKLHNYAANSKDFATICKATRDKWAEEVAKVNTDTKEQVSKAADKLGELEKEKKMASLQHARAKAKEGQKAAKRRRVIHLGS